MTKKFGLFINLDYAHKDSNDCTLIWQQIMEKMLSNGFSFEKRAFVVKSDQSTEALSSDIRKLFDELYASQQDLYSYIADCYILDLANCTDLTLPDTSNSINVEDISLEELNELGIEYNLLFEKKS